VSSRRVEGSFRDACKDARVSFSFGARGHSRPERRKLTRDLTRAQVRDRVGTDQIAYYRARASWYDDVYSCTGDYDRGPELNGQWRADLATIEAALVRAGLHGACVELGAGTGYWTERILDLVDRVWALDAVAEVLEIARARLGPRATHVEFEVADLWHWAPTRAWDCALACFFIEHVPDEVLPELLGTLHDALRPGGAVFVAEAAAFAAEPQVETREIDGRQFQVVERRRTPAELTEMFETAGFSVEVTDSGRVVHLTGRRN
jgi:SAM-dependent methyltransferase